MGLIETLLNLARSFLCGTGRPEDTAPSGPPPQSQQGSGRYPPQQQQQQHQQQPQRQQQPQAWQQAGGGSGAHHASSHPNKENQNQQQKRPQGQGKPLQKRYDDNAVNSANPQYKSLRARAHEEGDAMARCFRESKEAYQGGDGGRAKELSNEGKRHQAEMERLNKEASQWIFRENNLDSAGDELDLHGLYVKEAIAQTDSAIVAAQNRGDSEIRIIVGKGLHSQGSKAKIKPAIEELMVKHRLTAALDPHNSGVLVVKLNQGGHGMDSDELAQRVEDNQCTIM